MHGQRLTIRIISTTAELYLSAGHTYRVRVNADQRAPRVVKMFAEAEG